MQFRQGDLLFCAEFDLPLSASIQPGPVVAGGQGSDHIHLLDGPGSLYRSGNSLYVSSQQPTWIWHPEHSRLALPPGTFRVIQQRQYEP